MRVFVLLFNARTDNEGIHSIREGDRDKILMFESEDDATRYALMLEAQDFRSPTVEAMNDEDIKQFCKEAGYNWEIVPKDSDALAIPPQVNLEQPDWQADAKKDKTGSETSPSNQESQKKQELSDSELDSIRRKLEGLL